PAREADGARRDHPAETRPALSHDGAVHRRHGILRREDLRYRGLAAGTEPVSRDILVLELRILPGAARRNPLSRRGSQREEKRVPPHAERPRTGSGKDVAGHPRELSAERWFSHHPRSLETLHGRRQDHGQEVLRETMGMWKTIKGYIAWE